MNFLHFLDSCCQSKQGFADNVTLLSCNATLPAFTDSSSLFHLSVFFTGTYALSVMFMPLPQPASDLSPYFPYWSVWPLCSFTAWGNVSSCFQGNVVITITHLAKLSWFYTLSTFPPFSKEHTTLPGSQRAVLLLLGRATNLRKN